ncbi:MAG: cyclopropane-fatty-acyl-phospholipid synthase [Legionellaceae bacterium]|nr:cyclopropane-fatty-acyl-phospholipid synthase [Legionellaceae bacterium]|tara:strand:+ start:660 stop:1808 length:1149 start_codon:yes stop_codon:yes gene_type:complete
MKKTPPIFTELAELAGFEFNGPNPWDPQIHDPRFYSRILHQGTLGSGESYMDGWWDCEQLDEFCNRVIRANLPEKILKSGKILNLIWHKLNIFQAMVINLQTKKRALKVGEVHYDVGNNLYQKMLDKGMNYTCGYWKTAQTLDEAQEAKVKLVCDKLYLKPGDRVLDIGCGWGGFAKYAAENYGAHVVGVTISKEQLALGQERCKGLPVELRFQDYRDVNEEFDHVVSLGMIEHVGYKNFKTYMNVAHRCLKQDGLFLLHTIGNSTPVLKPEAWIGKYIFPNSMVPSASQLTKAYEGLFVMEDWHNFGPYYDKTLLAWFNNFNQAWPELKTDFGNERQQERFYRMWRYYLLSCAGAFRSRDMQLWQIVLSKGGVPGGYTSIR